MDTKLYAVLNELAILVEKAKNLLNIVYCNMSTIKAHTTKIHTNTLSRSNT